MQNTNNILQILETIQSFQIVQCQMHHEKVVTDVDENPIHNLQDDTIVFNRVKLCEIKQRNKRLGCAHSGVNINFERVLDNLITALPQSIKQISESKNKFKSVVTKIYALDHKVGNLEHDLAICKLTNDDCGKDNLMASMRLLKTEHTTLMDQLSKIKADIERLIKININYNNL
ncbi:MAG: hypothetical protein V7719_02945 [Psychroserpens sp.]|uniref:hypothetical protein n=1 Tax=Psychroserpens sp. TaxID=2020870 RepID=UPI003001662C